MPIKLTFRRHGIIEARAHELADEWLEGALAAGLSVALNEQARRYESMIERMETHSFRRVSELGLEQSGAVTAHWRIEIPPGWLLQKAISSACPDCSADIRVFEHDQVDGEFEMLLVHDETCPWINA